MDTALLTAPLVPPTDTLQRTAPVTPERAQQLLDVLTWPGRYVVPSNPMSAKMLALWLAHRSRGNGRRPRSSCRCTRP